MEEKIENYKLLGIKKKHSNKSDKDYYLAYVLYENSYDFDVLRIMIQDKQVEHLKTVLGDDTFNLKNFLDLQYNTFTKKYEMKISFGL